MVDDDSWPPEQLKNFTPLLLVHYKGHRSSKQVTATAKLMYRGEITSLVSNQSRIASTCHSSSDSLEMVQEILDTSVVTKKLEEILVPLESHDEPCLILIEGAPGIGKSVLLKEIAYQWGKKHLLPMFKVVLLICLRNPILQQAKSLPDLLQYFCKGDPCAIKIATECSEYFFDNGGKDLVFLFDGFDELPEKLQRNSLIVDILKRHVLPSCGLVVSSRPHATKQFHKQATLRADILGFTEKERNHHIQEALQGQPHKIKELTHYLKHHLTISSLCYIPFNLIVLIYLYKQGICLPRNSTELYGSFICHTISRHLAKHSDSRNIAKLTDLPEPCNKIIQQLCKLSLEGLNCNKLIFTLDEIKATCPNVSAIPGAINGFGLLQAVEHFDLTGTTMTFNFLHFSIQEYLAAYHITSLQDDKEFRIIKEKFWSDFHFNMFSIYITLTKGQRPSFKYFLCGGNRTVNISDRFLNDNLLCFRLYRYFHEAGDTDICKTIELSKKFANKKIFLSGTTLTANDVECFTAFLTSSFNREWVVIDLLNCYIQDHGLNILYQGLCHCNNDITIDVLWLENNSLTTLSSSLISEITVKCNVKELWITDNENIGADQQLYHMLNDTSTKLEKLEMIGIKLSSQGAISLFEALKDNSKLKVLNITDNEIADYACDAISIALKKNCCLTRLYMYNNPLTGEAIVNIVNDMHANNTLAVLGLPKCPKGFDNKIFYLQKIINGNRESQGYQVNLTIDLCN